MNEEDIHDPKQDQTQRKEYIYGSNGNDQLGGIGRDV